MAFRISVIMLCVMLCMKVLSGISSLVGNCEDLSFVIALCAITTMLYNLVARHRVETSCYEFQWFMLCRGKKDN